MVIRVGLVSRLDGDDALKVALRLYKGMTRKEVDGNDIVDWNR